MFAATSASSSEPPQAGPIRAAQPGIAAVRGPALTRPGYGRPVRFPRSLRSGRCPRCYPRRPVLSPATRTPRSPVRPGERERDGAPEARSRPEPGPARRRPALDRRARALRDRAAHHCVRMLAVAKSGHLDSSLSAADIVAALYYQVLRHDPAGPGLARARPLRALQGSRGPDPVRGAGRARLLPDQDLMGLRQIGSHLQGHPDMTRTPGSRSPPARSGQGLSMWSASASRCGSTASTRPRRSSA